ncbi:MAG: hypothetical protein ACKO9G_07625, partial [Dolichospermum sp.]
MLTTNIVTKPCIDCNMVDITSSINTFVGVLLNAVINYLISDRLVFKTPVQSDQTRTQFTTKIYYPEGLAPGLESKSSHIKHSELDNLTEIKVFSIVIP